MSDGSGRSKKHDSKAGSSASTPAGADATGKPKQTQQDSEGSAPFYRLHIWQIQAFRDVLLVAAVVGVVWLGYALRAVTVPLLVALLLAYLFEPLVRRMTANKRMNRPVAVGGLLCGIGGVVLLGLAIVVPLAVGQTVGFVNDFNDGTLHRRISAAVDWAPDSIQAEVDDLLSILPEASVDADEASPAPPQESGEGVGAGGEQSDGTTEEANARTPLSEEDVRRIVGEELGRAGAEGQPDGGGLLGLAGDTWSTIRSVLGASVYFALLVFLIPFYFFFFAVGYDRVLGFLKRLIPRRHEQRALQLASKMDVVVSGFVRGRLIICLITGILLAVGWFVCGVPYAIVIGLATGAMFLVPYLGGLGYLIALAAALINGFDDPARGDLWLLPALLWPSLWFGVVQVVESYILTPKIAGKATNLDPVTIIVAVLAGGSILGVYGMLLSIPLAACGKILLIEVVFPQVDAWLRGDRADPLPIEHKD